MPANFVILYGSKVGSTALVSNLSAQRGICVPLLEELDKYLLSKTKTDLHDTMRNVFDTGKFGDITHTAALKPCNDAVSVGFKWRFWGEYQPAINVLKDKNAHLFILTRRNFLENCCAFYQQEFGAKNLLSGAYEVNPQFLFARGSDPELHPDIGGIRKQIFSVDPADFAKAISYKAFETKKYLAIAKEMTKHGIPTQQIFYEDFDSDPAQFVTRFKARLGFDDTAPYNPWCAFSKTHTKPNSERMFGLKDLLQKSKFASFYEENKEEYRASQATIEKLAAN